MTIHGGIDKKNPSYVLDPQRRSLLTAIASYATRAEDEIEDIHHFRSSAQPKFAENDLQITRIRSEIDELCRLSDSTYFESSNSSTDSPGTPQDTRTPQKEALDDARIAKLVTSLEHSRNVQIPPEQILQVVVHEDRGSTESDRIAPVQKIPAQRKKNAPAQPAADKDKQPSPSRGGASDGTVHTTATGYGKRRAAIRRVDGGRLGSPALARNRQGLSGRPCTFPGDPCNFDFTFPETPTQDPGDVHHAWIDSDDD